MIDFLDFSDSAPVGYPEGITPLFACSASTDAGEGSVAITPEAVYLGEDGEVTRIDTVDIRSWKSASRGPLFALTVQCDEAHVTYLVPELRPATVSAMTRVIGPEGVRLHAA